ncbi:MAG: heme biosynthesis protein HemY [Gammaproteobacteria bacterium]|nr:heme biosynthesis protein HemY [Gammaproteobacteria bacterium]
MKLLLIVIATVLAAAMLTLAAMKDRGYVLINFHGWTVESSLVTWLVLLILLFVTLHLGLRFIYKLWRVPHDLHDWRRQRRIDRANKALLSGLVALAEGKWQQAEREVVKFASDSASPLLNYLAAARASHELNEFDRRDRYLKMANQNANGADVAVKLTQAQLQYNQQHLEQALVTLKHVQQTEPKHKTVIKTLARLYAELEDWSNLVNLIPQLRKYKMLTSDEIYQIERQAYANLINHSQGNKAQSLSQVWYRMPVEMQHDLKLLISYIKQLIKQGGSDVAEPLIRNALKRQWSDELVYLYGLIDGADAKSQLEYGENWLQQHENNAILLLTLGRLSLRNHLWGKARNYFEASIGAGGPAEVHNELGHLLENLGEAQAASHCYREGLAKLHGHETTASIVTAPLELEHKPANNPLPTATEGVRYKAM